MKRIIAFLACAALLVASAASCNKNTPDNQVTIKSISLPQSLNPVLSADVEGSISSRTITFILPESITTTSFIPVFELSDYDVLSQYGTVLTSGSTSCSFADGDTLHISDEVSELNSNYVIAIKYDDGKAELTYVAFLANDNTLLMKDVIPSKISDEMSVSVPAAAYMRNLTLTVKGGSNDVVKVNHAELDSDDKTTVDTGFPIEIEVEDEVSGISRKYVLNVQSE